MADTETTDAPEGAEDTEATQEAAEAPQGDEGTDWKAMARKHEREAKKARQEADRLREQTQTAEEKALEDAKAAGRSEAETEYGTQVMTLRMENAVLRSEQAKKLADPADALLLLKPADLVDDDGQVDTKKLGAAIDDLLDKKPYLSAGTPPPKVPGGPRGAEAADSADMNTRIRQAAGRA